MPSLFEMLGGYSLLHQVVMELRRRVIEDPELAPLLDRPEVEAKWNLLIQFLATTCGGPGQYQGRRLRWAHLRHSIRGDQFRLFLGHLSEAMLACGTPPNLVARMMAQLAPLREEIAACPTMCDIPVASPPPEPQPVAPAASVGNGALGGTGAGLASGGNGQRPHPHGLEPPAGGGRISSPSRLALREIEGWTNEKPDR